MTRELFPFILLGEGHGSNTTAAGMPELKPETREAVTRQANVRDFRPNSPSTQPKVRPEVVVEGGSPKASSATGDAGSSQTGSTTSPSQNEDTNASATKESSPSDNSDQDEHGKTTGSDEPPVQESTPETEKILTSSFLQS